MTHGDALPLDTVLNGNFRITTVLGRGGFSITYKAVDLQLDVVRVIKEYFPFESAYRQRNGAVVTQGAECQAQFDWGLRRSKEAAQRLAGLSHPAIVRTFYHFEQNGTIYTVLEFIEGESLKAWSKNPSNLSNAAVEALAIGLLDALAHLHAHNVLHRDIAPDNIIVRPDGTPVFVDFSVGLTSSMPSKGALFAIVREHFAAPEAHMPDGRLVGPPTDLYALGATLYQVVTGMRPPSAVDRMTVADDTVSARNAADGRFSPALLHAIDAALRLHINERPQSAAEMRDMLRSDKHAPPAQSAPHIGFPESLPSSALPDAFGADPPRQRRRKSLGIVRDPSTPVTSDALAEQHRREHKASEPTTAPASAAASVFAPARMRARASALIQVFLHAPTDAARAAEVATAIDPARGRQITQDLTLPLRTGDKVRVDYDGAGLNVVKATDRSQIITWTGQPRSVNFEVRALFTVFGRTHRPVVTFTRLGDVPVSLGHIQFAVEVGLRAPSLEPRFIGEARRHGRAFLSYAAEDRTEVLKRAQAFRAAGVEIFQDILELAPGERWERRLYDEIDRVDVFYLFWSGSARRSKWVRKEARQALKRQLGPGAGAPRIVPIVLERPPPPPPRFLRHIHFGDLIGTMIS